MATTHELTFSDAVLAKINPLLIKGNRLLLSYDDGVGPYSHHGLMALQISFQLIVVGEAADITDYQATLPSNLGPVHYKDYSGEFLGHHLQADFNTLMHTIRLSDESEQIDDDVALIIDPSAAK